MRRRQRSARPAGPRRRRAGFTLIEVVITLAITALVMLGLVSALATFGQSRARVETQLARLDQVRLVSAFLRGALGRSSGAYLERARDGGATALFEGGSQELRWLGVMPARHAVGGLHLFRLYAAPAPAPGSDPALMLQYLPYSGSGLEVAWDEAPERVLVPGLGRLDLAYRGDSAAADWQPEWRGSAVPPTLVRVALASAGREWPELVVRVRADDLSGGGVRVVHGPVE